MTNLRRTLRLVCASVLLHATPGAAQTWSDLLKKAQDGPVEFTREIVAGDATIGIVQGSGANWVPHGILARVAWIDGVEVTLAEDLVSLTVIDRSGPAGEARVLAWSDAEPILARVLGAPRRHRTDAARVPRWPTSRRTAVSCRCRRRSPPRYGWDRPTGSISW